jgi:hypothetical protein
MTKGFAVKKLIQWNSVDVDDKGMAHEPSTIKNK